LPGGILTTTLLISTTEQANQRFDPERLNQAVRSVQGDSFVILENCVASEHAEALCQKILADNDTILASEDKPFNFNVSDIQQDPPPFPPYLHKNVLLNPFVIAIIKAISGPDVKNSFYSSNSALPRQGGRQPVHTDSGQL
jgi:hypothetical protein